MLTLISSCKKNNLDEDIKGSWITTTDTFNVDRLDQNACGFFTPSTPCVFTVGEKSISFCDESCIDFFDEKNSTKVYTEEGQIFYVKNNLVGKERVYVYDYQIEGEHLWIIYESSEIYTNPTKNGLRMERY
ncbi:MAG: hypothetical protein JKY42_06810 [Flavobacteriales bacterium]|nr:hypothetical protein [Flavobacteriales bacterium]